MIDDPDYDYKIESELVLQRLAETAMNITRKAVIETMDFKADVTNLLQINHWSAFNPTYEQNVIFETGNRIAEYQGALLSWREKMRYNLIRPTTIIQSGKFTDDYITTYGGPFQGIQTIRTQDFQPYIRTMPHSEYPSGSTCICRMLKDHIDEYVQNEYGAPSLPVQFIFLRFIINQQLSAIEPGSGVEFVTFPYQTMQQLYEDCAQSRLWGGMHFTAAIQASDKLCSNIGQGIYDYLQGLLSGNATANRRRTRRRTTRRMSSSMMNNATGAQMYLRNVMDKINKGREKLEKVMMANNNDCGATNDNDTKVFNLMMVNIVLSVTIFVLLVFVVVDKTINKKINKTNM